MWLLDFVELGVTVALLVLAPMANTIVFLTLNLLGCMLKLMGSLLRQRKTSLSIHLNCRLIAIVVTIAAYGLQLVLTYFLTSSAFTYDNLGLYLCQFCAKSYCETEFHDNRGEVLYFGQGKPETVEEYAHKGISGKQCFIGSSVHTTLVLSPYLLF